MIQELATSVTQTDGFHLSVDLGQVIISLLIGIIGWFIKREMQSFSNKLAKHESVLFDLNGSVQRLVGNYDAWGGIERRNK